jgi:hypothetical protein
MSQSVEAGRGRATVNEGRVNWKWELGSSLYTRKRQKRGNAWWLVLPIPIGILLQFSMYLVPISCN